MKLKLFSIIFTLALVFSLAGCGEKTNNNSDNLMSDITSGIDSAKDKVESGVQSAEDMLDGNASSDAKISKDRAKQIALEHAKLKESDIKNYRIKLDRDDGVLVYELEFDHNNYEYDYEIDANTGAIREHDKDHLD